MHNLVDCFTSVQEATMYIKSFLCKLFSRLIDCKQCMGFVGNLLFVPAVKEF